MRRPFLFLGLGCRAGVPAVAGWILCRLPVAGLLVSVLTFVARADIFFLTGNCRDWRRGSVDRRGDLCRAEMLETPVM